MELWCVAVARRPSHEAAGLWGLRVACVDVSIRGCMVFSWGVIVVFRDLALDPLSGA